MEGRRSPRHPAAAHPLKDALPVLALGLLFAACVRDDVDQAPVSAGEGLLINEYLASNDAAGRDEHGEADDWVELYNPTAAALPLDGLLLSDDLADPAKFMLEAGDSLLPPGGHALVWCDNQPEQGPFHAPFALSAGGEEIGLFDASGARLDQVQFGAQTTDVSEGRSPDGGPAWTAFASPTPGAPNRAVVPLPRLLVNEFLASNNACCVDENGEYDDWIELVNAGDASAVLGGIYLSDDAADPLKWRLEPAVDTLLAPGAFCVVWCDNATATQGAFHAGFALSGGGEEIVLTDADGETALDMTSYGAQQSDVSSGRDPDGGDAWTTFATPTPGAPNAP